MQQVLSAHGPLHLTLFFVRNILPAGVALVEPPAVLTKHIQLGAASSWELSEVLLLCPRLGIQFVTVAPGALGGPFKKLPALFNLRVRSLRRHYDDIKQEHAFPLPRWQGVDGDGNFRTFSATGYPPVMN